MIRKFIKWGLSLVKSAVDESVPEEQLHAYLYRGLIEFKDNLEAGAIALERSQVMELIELVGNLEHGGFPGLPSLSKWAGVSPSNMDSDHQPTNGALLHQGLIDRAIIEDLAVASRQGKPLEDLDRAMLEGLLRHIEVRRRGGLHFIGHTPNHKRWPAVALISSLFSRVARAEGDLRYLNAALKLNDWSYRHFNRTREVHAGLGYLCALLDAEWALLELTG